MYSIDSLLEIMQQLRDPGRGCPWDREQTLASLVPFTLEEAYEVAETIEAGELKELPDELGDLLFQIVFYAQVGKELGEFDFKTIIEKICDKLIRRHPHVFADEQIANAAEQTLAWEKHKARERQNSAAAEVSTSQTLHGVSLALPALTRAAKLQRRAARVGFDWPDFHGVIDKLREETAELEQAIAQQSDKPVLADEIGDLLFSCVNLARHLDIDPETALRQANKKFERRFAFVEQQLAVQGGVQQASLDEMEQAWQQAKRAEQEQG